MKVAERFQRLLCVRMGREHTDVAVTSILSAATIKQADARLTLILTYGNTETTSAMNVEAATPEVQEPRAAAEPQATPLRATGRRKALVNQATAGVWRAGFLQANACAIPQ